MFPSISSFSFSLLFLLKSRSSGNRDSGIMSTTTMATAVGAAALLYYTLNRRLQSHEIDKDEDHNGNDSQDVVPLGIERVSHRLIQAPATWLETISTLSETLRFTYSETLAKWPIGDLAFGINFLMKKQGKYHVESVFADKDSLQLKGSDITAELKHLLTLLTLCWHFSKKPFPLFLKETGYNDENVLFQEPKAGILKPAFTIIVDHEMRCFLLLIRGTHSIKDTLTAVTGSVVPFHHSVVHQGGVSDLVLGYAHGGMLAAARWIAKLSTPCLLEALSRYPSYNVKVMASAWINDLRTQIQQTRIISTVCRSASALGSRLPSIAAARSKVAGAGAMLQPVSNGTQVVMRRAKSMAQAAWMRPSLNLSSWSCIGPRRRAISHSTSKDEANSPTCSTSNNEESLDQPLYTTKKGVNSENMNIPVSSSVEEWYSEIGCADERSMIDERHADHPSDILEDGRYVDHVNEVLLWHELEHQLYESSNGEEGNVVKEIREEETEITEVSGAQTQSSTSEMKEVHRFFPPGKIMHIVTLHCNASDSENNSSQTSTSSDGREPDETKIGIFQTSRSLYSKIRLSQTMIADHFMPVYRKQIERLIQEVEEEEEEEGEEE
ncbi:hypothetical protein Ahy_B09g095894 isoform F [Arachis hypogaea]|uniref:Mono-/di-acylglycerol lipase N-terminal domain-containing protein n=1 Tax=Arachis hypogaea TaxID=3818 RepID=A0A444XGY7_ARAHY|nr:hypothetical protein Ahy_B09g095894 isoform F [Arachis hypogaea]